MQALRDAGSGNPEPRQEPTGLPLATLQWTGRSICAVPDGFATHPDIHGLLSARRCAARTCTKCVQLAACSGFGVATAHGRQNQLCLVCISTLRHSYFWLS